MSVESSLAGQAVVKFYFAIASTPLYGKEQYLESPPSHHLTDCNLCYFSLPLLGTK
jgi:hypothetical protein